VTELERAKRLAETVLDEPGADPDSDLAILSRQLLRALEPGPEASVEDRLVALLADLRKVSEGGKNPQLGRAAELVGEALSEVRIWVLGIVL